MEVVKLIKEMQYICSKLQRDGRKVRLVPTMGALHNGHASLIKAAKQEKEANGCLNHHIYPEEDVTKMDDCKRSPNGQTVIIVSIFLNRKQFNNQADFNNYPSTLDADLRLCSDLGVHYVFLPSNDEMYPPVRTSSDCLVVPPESIGRDLEGRARPGHFHGMLTCVCKLFNITKPSEAYFGEKDYQQLVLVSRMVQDLNMGITVVPVMTVRETDLLPLSSRNVRLEHDARKVAPIIYQILEDAKQALNDLHESPYAKTNKTIDLDMFLMASANTSMCLYLSHESRLQIEIDYLALRCSGDFSPIAFDPKLVVFYRKGVCRELQTDTITKEILECRLLIAAVVGGIRLIDNIGVELNLPKN